MRYFFGFLAAIGLIILVFILLLRAFTGGGNKNKTPQVSLADYASTNVQMRYTLDGPVTADQLHQGLRITVGQTQTSIEIYQGYQNNVVQSKTYPNNQNSYAQFLSALQHLGYNKGIKDPNRTDERGFCPSGDRFIFEIVNEDGGDSQRYWTTSCGGQGNYQGNVTSVRALFRQQIPDYDKLTANLEI